MRSNGDVARLRTNERKPHAKHHTQHQKTRRNATPCGRRHQRNATRPIRRRRHVHGPRRKKHRLLQPNLGQTVRPHRILHGRMGHAPRAHRPRRDRNRRLRARQIARRKPQHTRHMARHKQLRSRIRRTKTETHQRMGNATARASHGPSTHPTRIPPRQQSVPPHRRRIRKRYGRTGGLRRHKPLGHRRRPRMVHDTRGTGGRDGTRQGPHRRHDGRRA